MYGYLKIIQDEFNLKEKGKNTLYGVINGFEVTIVGSQTITLFLNFNASEDIKIEAAKEFKAYNGKSNFVNSIADIYGISAIVNGWTGKSAANSLIEKLKYVIDYLINQNAEGISKCLVCGKDFDIEKQTIRINDRYVTLCDECVNEFTELVEEENKVFDNAPNKYGVGILGAILGALIGCISWVILYFIGFLSAITGILGVFLSDLFYTKFGGKSNKVKLVIIALVNLVLMLLAPVAVYYVVIQGIMIQEGISGNPFVYIFEDKDICGPFLRDIVMNVIFTGLGVGIKLLDIYRKNKLNKTRITK